MLSAYLRKLTSTITDDEAWQAIFRYYYKRCWRARKTELPAL
jgi:hypothetical protein